MNKIALIVVTCMVFAAMSWAQAPVHKAARPGLFEKADANKDGKVTFEEAKAVMPKLTEQKFKEMDKNNDGVLTPNEMPKRDLVAEILKQADANKDGKVTFEELKAVRPKMTQERFNKIDRNKDGVISKEDKPKAATTPAPAQKTPPPTPAPSAPAAK